LIAPTRRRAAAAVLRPYRKPPDRSIVISGDTAPSENLIKLARVFIGAWAPPGATTGAIRGHEFGLRLDAVEREQLIAFLRTL
jgi:hypothetical protein